MSARSLALARPPIEFRRALSTRASGNFIGTYYYLRLYAPITLLRARARLRLSREPRERDNSAVRYFANYSSTAINGSILFFKYVSRIRV